MSPVSELEGKVRTLSANELREFRDWLAEYDAELWDRQFDADAASGRLDAIADRALKDFAENRTTDL